VRWKGLKFRVQSWKLKESQYDETITLEVFSKDRDCLRISKEKMKQIWEAV